MGVELLRSWKEVAAYLNVSVRTAQRWKEEFDLPVRRIKGKGASGVLALPDEIDQWLKQRLHGIETPTRALVQEELSIRALDIDITGLLWSRPARPHDCEKEAELLRSLIRPVATEAPGDVLHLLAQQVLDCCKAETAGVSLLEEEETGGVFFRCVAAVGTKAEFKGNYAPVNSMPCGICIERNAPQLYSYPERHFSGLQRLGPLLELLEVPIHDENEGVGVMWVACHEGPRRFDGEDARILRVAAGIAGVLVAKQSLTSTEPPASWREIVQNSFEGAVAFVAQLDGKAIRFTGEWNEHTGMTPEDAKDYGWLKIVHEDDIAALERAWTKCSKSGRSQEARFRMKGPAGTYQEHLMRVALFEYAPGKEAAQDGRLLIAFLPATDAAQEPHQDPHHGQAVAARSRGTR